MGNNQDKGSNRGVIIVAIVALLVIGLLAATLLNKDEEAQPVEDGAAARETALASEGAPAYGDPNAKVHIVEFLDPACGTCATFFPMVKQWMNEVPGQIRLSVRHVPFHSGAEHAVKVLEASREQGKYWETLETLLATQQQWVTNHVVQPERIAPAIASVGLDMERLEANMNSMEVLRRMEQDKQDAILLQVAKTPDYYVNGRPLQSFGAQQLADLVREELEK